MARRSRGDIPSLVLILLALVLLSLLLYRPQPAQQNSRPNVEDAPELIVKSIVYLNDSLRKLACSFKGGDCPSMGSKDEALQLRDTLLTLASSSQLGSGDFASSLRESLKSYARVAEAAASIYEAADSLNGVEKEVREVLSLLLECNVTETLNKWMGIFDKVKEGTRNLGRASLALSLVNRSALLSDSHRRLTREASEGVTSLLEGFSEVSHLMEIVLRDPEGFRELCLSRHGSKPCNLRTDRVAAIVSQLDRVRPSRGGPFSYEISRILSLMLNTGSRNGEGGFGAGYGQPSTDD